MSVTLSHPVTFLISACSGLLQYSSCTVYDKGIGYGQGDNVGAAQKACLKVGLRFKFL